MAVILGTPEPNTLLTPRFMAVIEGKVWKDVTLGSIELASYQYSGSFSLSVTMRTSGDFSDDDVMSSDSRLYKLLAPREDTKKVPVEIYLKYFPEGTDEPEKEAYGEPLFTGIIDTIELNWKDDLAEIKGRDRSAIIQDSTTYGQYRNTTVAGVIAEIAERNGLKSKIVDSGTTAGTVFDAEKIDIKATGTDGQNDWDIILKFADYDNYIAFVQGDTLFYQPMEDFKDRIEFKWGHNIDEIESHKNFSYQASKIGVEIASVSQKRKDAVVATAGAKRGGGGDKVIYRHVIPGLSTQEAGDIAQALAIIYSQFEFTCTIHTVGSSDQTLFNQYILSGTGSPYDNIYRILRIQWEFTLDAAWTAEISGVHLPADGQIKLKRSRQRGGGGGI